MFEVDLLKADEVAKMLKTTPSKITAAILNGTFPVGIVAEGSTTERTRTIIVKKRLEAWLNAEDLKGYKRLSGGK